MAGYVSCERCKAQTVKSGMEYSKGKMIAIFTCTCCNAPTAVIEEEKLATAN